MRRTSLVPRALLLTGGAPPASPGEVESPDVGGEPEKKPRKGVRRPGKGGLRVRLELAGGHAIEVRHGRAGGERTLKEFDLIELVDGGDEVTLPDGKKARWQQLAKLGAWEGHPSGPFELTAAHFDEIVRNFDDAEVSGGECVGDYEHASEQDPPPPGGAPASGWAKRLDNRGAAGLWGLVAWTKRAGAHIRDDEYRRISPAIRFNARHPVTGRRVGTRLSSFALTNQPFLRNMVKVAASARGALARPFVTTGDFLKRARVALGLHSTSMPREMKAQCANLRQHYEAAGDGDGALYSTNRLGVDLGDYTGGLMNMGDALGAPETMGDLLDALDARIDAAIAEHELERHDGAQMSDHDPGRGDAADDNAAQGRGDTDMAMPKDEKEYELRLSEARKQAEDKAAKDVADANARIAELNLTLKAEQGKNASIEADVKALKDAEVAREAAAVEADVDRAIADWGAEKGITAKDRAELVEYRRALPAGFSKLYPLKSTAGREDAARRVRMFAAGGSQHADPPRRPGDGAPGGDASPPAGRQPSEDDALDEVQLRDKFMREGKLSLADACVKAHGVVQARDGRGGEARAAERTEPVALVSYRGGRR